MLLGQWIDQVRDDPHSRPGPTNASFEDRRHPKFLRDRGDLLARLLVLHSGRARDDLERADFGELGDDVISDPVAEVLILRVSAHVLERQDGDRLRGGERLRGEDFLEHRLGRPHRDGHSCRGAQGLGELGGGREPIGGQSSERLPHGRIDCFRNQLTACPGRRLRAGQPVGDDCLKRSPREW